MQARQLDELNSSRFISFFEQLRHSLLMQPCFLDFFV